MDSGPGRERATDTTSGGSPYALGSGGVGGDVLGFSPVSRSGPPAFVDASIRGMLIGIAELVLFLCLYLHQDFCWRDRQGSCTTKGSPDDCRPYYRGSYLMFVYLFVSSHFFGPTIYTQFETKKQTPPLLPP